MNDQINESFEKTRIVGSIAAGALDEVLKLLSLESLQNKSISCVMNILMIMVHTLLHYSIEVFQNHVVLLPIILFAMEYPQIKF